MTKKGGAIDISQYMGAVSPRSAKEVAEKKLRAELRQAGDAAGSKKTGAERDDDLKAYYEKKNQEKTDHATKVKQTMMLSSPIQSLIECACGGAARADDFNFLMSRGVDLDGQYNGVTALVAAARHGCQYGLEALIRAGATVDGTADGGVTPLMAAASAGNLPAVTFLLDHSGARPELMDSAKTTALMRAYERGHAVIASKLVKALASPPARVTTVAKQRAKDAKMRAAELRAQQIQSADDDDEKDAAKMREKRLAHKMSSTKKPSMQQMDLKDEDEDEDS